MRRESDHEYSLLVAGVLAITILIPGMGVGKEAESNSVPIMKAFVANPGPRPPPPAEATCATLSVRKKFFISFLPGLQIFAK